MSDSISTGVSARTRNVWIALLATMTGVGGMLWAVEGGPLPSLRGLSLPAMVAAGGPNSVEVVFETRHPLDVERWQAIVIHHSGSVVGSPATIADEHVQRYRLTGLGHHFIVGNGRGMQDGEIHVGYRWLDQLPGAHVAGEQGAWYNRYAIGICLVGDGTRAGFSDDQMRRLVDLVSALSREFDIPADRILLHSDLAETSSPGPFFPAAAFREALSAAR
jgi:N-acetyl-anhydromuramyl-L-alanine amidase AmpD